MTQPTTEAEFTVEDQRTDTQNKASEAPSTGEDPGTTPGSQPQPQQRVIALGLSDKAREKIAKARKTAQQLAQEEEVSRQRERDERNAARKAARELQQGKRDRASESDKALGAALDDLERLQAVANTSKKTRERAEERAAVLRRTIDRLKVELERAQSELSAIEDNLSGSETTAALEASTKAAEAAWAEHNDAWSDLPRGYVKKHRDRMVRKRARLSGIARR